MFSNFRGVPPLDPSLGFTYWLDMLKSRASILKRRSANVCNIFDTVICLSYFCIHSALYSLRNPFSIISCTVAIYFRILQNCKHRHPHLYSYWLNNLQSSDSREVGSGRGLVKLLEASLFLNVWQYIQLIGISPIVHFFFFVQLFQASGSKLKTKYHTFETFPKFCRKIIGRSNAKSIHWHINTWPVRHFDNKRWGQTSFMDSGLLCVLRISISLIGIGIVNCRWCGMTWGEW